MPHDINHVEAQLDSAKFSLFPAKSKSTESPFHVNSPSVKFTPFSVAYLYPKFNTEITGEKPANTKSKKNKKQKIEVDSSDENVRNTKKTPSFDDQEKTSVNIISDLKAYPNPSQYQLNISFSLERKSLVSIKIIDLLGNEVTTLSNEVTDTGKTVKNFSIAGKINSGTYFVKVEAGNTMKIVRIIIL